MASFLPVDESTAPTASLQRIEEGKTGFGAAARLTKAACPRDLGQQS
ncbi:hypothetical protein [Salipiger bermudensis]|nr:hypothetical protein [Salipiger bermudensis]MCA0963096.1 hypothetical protein [Salipiger bermudensis]